MGLITEKNLAAAVAGEMATLVRFDAHGLLLAPDESLSDYAERLRTLDHNIGELKKELAEAGELDVFETRLRAKDAIPASVFRTAQATNRALYDFEIDWVPGFYTNHRMGLLFAGCAIYSYDDFFAIFIVRKAFQKKARWLIYSRAELISHELCHIAHIGFRSVNFEEIFAYQTSESRFRRAIGGLLRTTMDTYLLLGSVSLLLVAQLINLGTGARLPVYTFPLSAAYAVSFSIILFIILRFRHFWGQFSRARRALARVYSGEQPMAVLFRCADEEIADLAELRHADEVTAWLRERAGADVRWRIITTRYPVS